MFKVCSDNRYFGILGILIVLLYMMPYFVLGENAYITIHDFLDSNVAHHVNIIALHLVGDPDGVLPVLDGVSALNYMSLFPIDVKSVLYMILPPYWAIVFYTMFVKIGAYVGMYLLTINYIAKGDKLSSLITAISFSMIPFYVDYGWSSAGIPLLLYSICNLENQKRMLLSYFLIVLYGLNSALSLSGFFICFLWFVEIACKRYRLGTTPRSQICGLILLVIIYMLMNISIIYNFFFPSETISHRVEFSDNDTFIDNCSRFFSIILYSQYHAGGFLAYILLLIVFGVMFFYIRKDWSVKYYIGLYVMMLFLIFVGILVRYLPLQIFRAFQFDRFYFLYPTLCFVLISKAFSLIKSRYEKQIKILFGLILFGAVLICDNEFMHNINKLLGRNIPHSPSYYQFFDKELFEIIKNDIGTYKPFATKVVSVGLFPSIAEMNSFYTLDSYVFNYSLDYKHKFRRVIVKELDKNPKLRAYYDYWGSRCYLFSSELEEQCNQNLCSKTDNIRINHLDIDTGVLKELGCEYVLSAVDIENYLDLNLDFVKCYTLDTSYWMIRVYKLN